MNAMPLGVFYAVKRADETVGYVHGELACYPKGAEKVSRAALDALGQSTQVYNDFSKEASLDHLWKQVPLSYFETATLKMMKLMLRELQLIAPCSDSIFTRGFLSLPFNDRVLRFITYFEAKVSEQLPLEVDDRSWLAGRQPKELSKICDVTLGDQYFPFDDRVVALQVREEVDLLNRMFNAFQKGDVAALRDCFAASKPFFGMPTDFESNSARLIASKIAELCSSGTEVPFIICSAKAAVAEVFEACLKDKGYTLEQIR